DFTLEYLQKKEKELFWEFQRDVKMLIEDIQDVIRETKEEMEMTMDELKEIEKKIDDMLGGDKNDFQRQFKGNREIGG
ncbi:MAG: hypothetical protein J7K62_01925, partial [Thermoplasmata archaeon]|nr:hypothetical protein [Thermoplasmata archaeon]